MSVVAPARYPGSQHVGSGLDVEGISWSKGTRRYETNYWTLRTHWHTAGSNSSSNSR